MFRVGSTVFTHTHTSTPNYSPVVATLAQYYRAIGGKVMGGTAWAQPLAVTSVCRTILLWKAFGVIGGRTEFAADQGAGLSALQAGVHVDVPQAMRERGIDHKMLVAHHAAVIQGLAASNKAGCLVERKGALDALDELGRSFGWAPQILLHGTSCTLVQRTAQCAFSGVYLEEFVWLGAGEMVVLITARVGAGCQLPI